MPIVQSAGSRLRPWDAALMLSFMHKAGIDVAVTSIPTSGVHLETTRALVNELLAELVQTYPNHLGGFAALPLPRRPGGTDLRPG